MTARTEANPFIEDRVSVGRHRYPEGFGPGFEGVGARRYLASELRSTLRLLDVLEHSVGYQPRHQLPTDPSPVGGGGITSPEGAATPQLPAESESSSVGAGAVCGMEVGGQPRTANKPPADFPAAGSGVASGFAGTGTDATPLPAAENERNTPHRRTQPSMHGGLSKTDRSTPYRKKSSHQ